MAKPLARRGLSVMLPAGPSEGAVTTSLWPQYWDQGVELFTASGDPAFTSGRGHRAMLEALGTVEKLVNAGVTPTSVAAFGSEDDANPDIVAGRVAMFLGGSWQATALNDLLPEKDFFTRWGAAPLPSLSGDRHVTSAGGWVWAAFTDDRGAVDTGMDWLVKTFVSDAGMAAWCSAGGYLPPRTGVYDRHDYVRTPFTDVYRDHLEKYARTRPPDRGYLDVSRTMQTALSSVASRSLGAAQALDQALDRLV
jgi:multiple sugar transport system substrate-binding protein